MPESGAVDSQSSAGDNGGNASEEWSGASPKVNGVEAEIKMCIRDRRRVVGRGATLERSESGVGQHIGPGGADSFYAKLS